MNIKLVASAFFLLGSFFVHADSSDDSYTISHGVDVRYKVDLQAPGSSNMIESLAVDYTYSDWEEYGEPYNCTYSPLESEIMKGVIFDQTAYCVQLQKRYKYKFEYAILTGKVEEFREIDASHDSEKVGILTYSDKVEYSSWYNVGSLYSCTGYSPDQSTVYTGIQFAQSRTCSQAQDVVKSTYRVNDITGAKALTSEEIEHRVISVTDSRVVSGTKARKTWHRSSGNVTSRPDVLNVQGTVYRRREADPYPELTGECDTSINYYFTYSYSSRYEEWHTLFYKCY